MIIISVLIFFSEEKSERLIQQERGGVRESYSENFLLIFYETCVLVDIDDLVKSILLDSGKISPTIKIHLDPNPSSNPNV